jgi:hypothetical protein
VATSTSTTSPTPTGPTFASGNASFKLLGCYREQDGGRALQDQVADDAMTVDRCLVAAAGRTFAGVSYGRECWFGSSLRSPLIKVSDDNCKFLCAGDPLHYCGSGNHLVLYSLDGVEPKMPSQPSSVGGAAFHGCMTEATGARALAGASKASGDMTLEKCGEFCGTFQYFGVEYGQECKSNYGVLRREQPS